MFVSFVAIRTYSERCTFYTGLIVPNSTWIPCICRFSSWPVSGDCCIMLHCGTAICIYLPEKVISSTSTSSTGFQLADSSIQVCEQLPNQKLEECRKQAVWQRVWEHLTWKCLKYKAEFALQVVLFGSFLKRMIQAQVLRELLPMRTYNVHSRLKASSFSTMTKLFGFGRVPGNSSFRSSISCVACFPKAEGSVVPNFETICKSNKEYIDYTYVYIYIYTVYIHVYDYCIYIYYIPVVPHKAAAEVSKIGNL